MHSKQKGLKSDRINSNKALEIALSTYRKKDFEDWWMGLVNGKNAPEWNINFRRKGKKPF